MFSNYFSSLKRTYGFMICFGLLMGVVFPFYSAIFFGTRAFDPLYIAGCLTAGLLVGSFSYFCIKQSLKLFLEKQLTTLARVAGSNGAAAAAVAGKDELQTLMDYHERVLERVLGMVDNLTEIVAGIVPLYQTLRLDAETMVADNGEQVSKSRAALEAVEGMRNSLQQMGAHVEQIADRSNEQVAVSEELSAAIGTVSENLQEYSVSVQETSASVEEMLATVRETAHTVEELAFSTEQTVTSIFQIGKSIVEVRDHINRTAVCSEDVQRRAGEGMTAMAVTLKAMTEIEQSSAVSFDSISKLAALTEQVGQILAVIRDVVEQTNLLSLNASIIAAQAGERGKSFAVVAGEVRDLARRTAQSAGQIEGLLQSIREESLRVHGNVSMGKEKATEGVRVATLANESLGKIGDSAAEVMEMVRRIVSASEEEARGSQMISSEAEKNLERLKQVTRSVQEQNQSSSRIMMTLTRMEELSRRISLAIAEQVRGVQLFGEGIHDTNESIGKLRQSATAEGTAAGEVVAFVRETGGLIETNAAKAGGIMADINAIAQLTLRLQEEMAVFRAAGG